MKLPKHLSTVMAISMVMGSMSFNVADADTRVETIVGSNRIDTSVKISMEGWKSADTVVLVNDSAIPDALTATPLAYAKKAPILLTNKKGLSKEVKDELKRLKTKNIIMIGGVSVLPSSIEKELKAMGLKTKRISGANREETALSIAKELDKIKDVSEVAVVNGTTGLADAVSIAAAAAERNMPVLLSNPKKGLVASEKFIKSEDISNSYVIGGTAVLPNKVLSYLPGMERVYGSNRNDTNARVIERFYKSKKIENMYVAKDGKKGADQLIDALSVGALAAKNGSPVLLVSNKKLSESQKNVINSKRTEVITQIGGRGNENAFNELKEIERVEIFNVNSEDEYRRALEEADANDIIVIEKGSGMGNNLTVTTKKAVTIEIKDDFAGNVLLDNTNADIINDANIGSLGIKNSNDTNIINNDKIGNIENNSTGTTINNNGEISNPITGAQDPVITGNKPGAGESTPNPTPSPEPSKPVVDEDKANIIKIAKKAADERFMPVYSKTITVKESNENKDLLDVNTDSAYEADGKNLKSDLEKYMINLHDIDSGETIKSIKYDEKEYTWDADKNGWINKNDNLAEVIKSKVDTKVSGNKVNCPVALTLIGNKDKSVDMNIKASFDYVASVGTIGSEEETGFNPKGNITNSYSGALVDAVKSIIDNPANKKGTVNLLKDYDGGGIGLFAADGHQNVDLTIDLNNKTYNCVNVAVGSKGTASQVFHLERGNTVKVKNGTVKSGYAGAKMVFQNYCDLTIENLTIDGGIYGENGLATNCSNTTMNGVNIINGKRGFVAIDVDFQRGGDYTNPKLVINNTSKDKIIGYIDVYCSGNSSDSDKNSLRPSLTLNGGRYSVNPTAETRSPHEYGDYITVRCAGQLGEGYKLITPNESNENMYEVVKK